MPAPTGGCKGQGREAAEEHQLGGGCWQGDVRHQPVAQVTFAIAAAAEAGVAQRVHQEAAV